MTLLLRRLPTLLSTPPRNKSIFKIIFKFGKKIEIKEEYELFYSISSSTKWPLYQNHGRIIKPEVVAVRVISNAV